MTTTTTQPVRLTLSKRMLIGAAIALTLITLYLLTVREPNPAWGKYWMVRPYLVMTFAGAMGGLCNYVIINFRSLVGLNKTMAIILSLLVFVVGLFMGFVVGLDGTLWN
jgi:hypothetical protein